MVSPCAFGCSFGGYRFLKKSLISSRKSVTRIEITATNIIRVSILDSQCGILPHTQPNSQKKKPKPPQKGLRLTTLDYIQNNHLPNGYKHSNSKTIIIQTQNLNRQTRLFQHFEIPLLFFPLNRSLLFSPPSTDKNRGA